MVAESDGLVGSLDDDDGDDDVAVGREDIDFTVVDDGVVGRAVGAVVAFVGNVGGEGGRVLDDETVVE